MRISIEKVEFFLEEIRKGHYSVSETGEVVNNITCRTIGFGNGRRPPTIGLYRNDKLVVISKHILIWSYFKGVPDPDSEIYFKDGDFNNCSLSNLVLAPHGTRAIETWKTMKGTIVGDKNANAKFTNDKARELREEYANTKVSARALARREGVSNPTIFDLLAGRTYPDAGGPVNVKKPNIGRKPGPDKTKLFLCWHILHKSKVSAVDAGKLLKINTSTVYKWSKRYDPSNYDKHRDIFVQAYKDKPGLLRKLGFPVIKGISNDSGSEVSVDALDRMLANEYNKVVKHVSQTK